MERFKLLICGSRSFTNYATIENYILDVAGECGAENLIVIQGGYRGADELAKRACRNLRIHCAEVAALWALGSPAGPARNRAMLDLEPHRVVAFPLDDSPGTWDCVREARRRAIETVVHHSEVA